MERLFERVLLASRWLLLPLLAGLALLLVLFIVEFFIELAELYSNIFNKRDGPQLTLTTLTLLDLVLLATLIIMVMLSGFWNFVARIDTSEAQQRLSGLARLDIGSLKIKFMVVIVVISAIHLLEELFDIEHIATEKVFWLVVLHLSFVATAVVLAVLDRMVEH